MKHFSRCMALIQDLPIFSRGTDTSFRAVTCSFDECSELPSLASRKGLERSSSCHLSATGYPFTFKPILLSGAFSHRSPWLCFLLCHLSPRTRSPLRSHTCSSACFGFILRHFPEVSNFYNAELRFFLFFPPNKE